MPNILQDILSQFDISGAFLEGALYGNGHINDSYLVKFNVASSQSKYLLQHINRQIFQDIPSLMRNIELISSHMLAKKDLQLLIPELVPTKGGNNYLLDSAGEYWRVLKFIDNAESFERTPDKHFAKEAALACARFQLGVLDFPHQKLAPSIPGFQNVPRRVCNLEELVRQDPLKRLGTCREEVAYLISRRQLADLLSPSSSMPTRAVHADLKINNILFQQGSGKALAIVDWDTLMPGTIAYDFGDFARSTCLRVDEDERDLSKVKFDLAIFEGVAEGYLPILSKHLTSDEKSILPQAPKVIALSLACRFLSDHLNGDKYFKIDRPQHNLDRARTQIKLLQHMELESAEIQAIVEKHLGNVHPPIHQTTKGT